MIEKIRILVGNGKLREAIKELLSTEISTVAKNEVLQLKSRIIDLESKEIKGIIGHKDYTVDRNKITDSLLKLMDNLSISNSSYNNKVVEIKFIDDIYPDEVSIKKLATVNIDELVIKIDWPSSIKKILSNLNDLILEVENFQEPDSSFAKVNHNIRNSFYDTAISAKEMSLRIINHAPKRIEYIIKDMEGYWGRISTNSYQIKTIKNYLILCCHRIISQVSYCFTYECIKKEKYLPEQLEKWIYSIDSPRKPFRQLFSFDEEIYRANVLYFSKEPINNYFWGEKSDIEKANKGNLKTRWVREFLIPQIELQFTLNNSEKRISYTEDVNVNFARDNNGEEI